MIFSKKKVVGSVFDLAGVPAWSQFYNFGIFIWKHIYRGFYSPWHVIRYVTPDKEDNKRRMYRLNLAKASAEELASLIWTEKCHITVSMDGSTEEDNPLQEFVDKVLERNNFRVKMSEHIAQSMALGGGALKVWADTRDEPEIKIGYCMADQFVPTKWDNSGISEALFISREARDGLYYTRVEWHKWDGATYVITNDVYQAEKGDDESNQDILGVWMPLAEIYPEIEPRTELKNIGQSLFSYYRVASANNLDDNSPLGISIYGNALDTLRASDQAYDAFCQLIQLSKPKVYVPYRMLKSVTDENGHTRHFYDPSSEAIAGLNMETPEGFEIKNLSPELQVDAHVDAINSLLNMYCLQVGFSPATFSFDKGEGIRTATEVISDNSKTYKTVKANQNMVEPAVRRLVENIITVGSLYDMTQDGQPIKSLAARGYEVAVVFDDSVIEDSTSNMHRGLELLGNGLISKKEMLTNKRYGIGMTDEQAQQMIEEIAAENQTVNAATLDIFKNYGGE